MLCYNPREVLVFYLHFQEKNKFIDDEAEDEDGNISEDDNEENRLLEEEVASLKRKKRNNVRLRLQMDSYNSDGNIEHINH